MSCGSQNGDFNLQKPGNDPALTLRLPNLYFSLADRKIWRKNTCIWTRKLLMKYFADIAIVFGETLGVETAFSGG